MFTECLFRRMFTHCLFSRMFTECLFRRMFTHCLFSRMFTESLLSRMFTECLFVTLDVHRVFVQQDVHRIMFTVCLFRRMFTACLFVQQDVHTVRLKLRKPKPIKKVQWRSGTVDNEHMNRRKSKCCCVYEKPRVFGESSSESEDEECENCHGHVERRSNSQTPPGDTASGSADNIGLPRVFDTPGTLYRWLSCRPLDLSPKSRQKLQWWRASPFPPPGDAPYALL
uniref:E3 ubiquitin-protein ligase PPP1R11 n=1 Tax=Timema monikensis TaxID=170555 RepID=A0A7R9E5Y6_9NEOP|nr:unnamed protein product [Timema monikensis]